MSATPEEIATLVAAVEARVAESLLIELTNPRAPGAAAVNSDTLEAACTDAVAALEAQSGVAFVVTSAVQVMLAVELVLALLYERAGSSEQAARHYKAAEPGLEALAKRAAQAPRSSRGKGEPFDFDAETWRGYRSDGAQ